MPSHLCPLHARPRRLVDGVCPTCAKYEAAAAEPNTTDIPEVPATFWKTARLSRPVELTPANRAALERTIRSRELTKADLARRHRADLARRRRPTEEE